MRPISFSVFLGNTEINKYDPVIHYSEVFWFDVLMDKAASVQFLDGLNHLDYYLSETLLAMEGFCVKVIFN